MIGHLFEPMGQYRIALAWFHEGLTHARAGNHREREATLLSDIGRVLGVLGEFAEALEYLKNAEPTIMSTCGLHALLAIRTRKATIYAVMQDFQPARAELEWVVADAERHGYITEYVDGLMRLAEVELRSGDIARGAEVARVAADVAKQSGSARSRAFASCTLAEALIASDDVPHARELLLAVASGHLDGHSLKEDLDLLRAFVERAALLADAEKRVYLSRDYRILAANLAALLRDEGMYRTYEHQSSLEALFEQIVRVNTTMGLVDNSDATKGNAHDGRQQD